MSERVSKPLQQCVYLGIQLLHTCCRGGAAAWRALASGAALQGLMDSYAAWCASPAVHRAFPLLAEAAGEAELKKSKAAVGLPDDDTKEDVEEEDAVADDPNEVAGQISDAYEHLFLLDATMKKKFDLDSVKRHHGTPCFHPQPRPVEWREYKAKSMPSDMPAAGRESGNRNHGLFQPVCVWKGKAYPLR